MHTIDGTTLCLDAHLPADLGAVVTAAIDRIADTLPDMPPDEGKLPVDREYTIYQRRADALMMLATARLAEDPDPDVATVVVNAPLAALQGEGAPHRGPERVAGTPQEAVTSRGPDLSGSSEGADRDDDAGRKRAWDSYLRDLDLPGSRFPDNGFTGGGFP
jgi:hypothetical protein